MNNPNTPYYRAVISGVPEASVQALKRYGIHNGVLWEGEDPRTMRAQILEQTTAHLGERDRHQASLQWQMRIDGVWEDCDDPRLYAA